MYLVANKLYLTCNTFQGQNCTNYSLPSCNTKKTLLLFNSDLSSKKRDHSLPPESTEASKKDQSLIAISGHRMGTPLSPVLFEKEEDFGTDIALRSRQLWADSGRG